MTVHELVTELLAVPNQNAPVTVRMWIAAWEIKAIHCRGGRSVELDWRECDETEETKA